MSDLVPLEGNSNFNFTAITDKLEDLAQFGVRLHPVIPTHKCVCGAYAGEPWSEGWGYDELCEPCYYREGGSTAFYDRIYTNQTVFVSEPILTGGNADYVDNGVRKQIHHSTLYGLVVVDKQLCLVSASLAHVEGDGWQRGWDSCNLRDHNTGEVIVRGAFRLSYGKLNKLRQTQAPL